MRSWNCPWMSPQTCTMHDVARQHGLNMHGLERNVELLQCFGAPPLIILTVTGAFTGCTLDSSTNISLTCAANMVMIKTQRHVAAKTTHVFTQGLELILLQELCLLDFLDPANSALSCDLSLQVHALCHITHQASRSLVLISAGLTERT
jgi:hypothetical protein